MGIGKFEVKAVGTITLEYCYNTADILSVYISYP